MNTLLKKLVVPVFLIIASCAKEEEAAPTAPANKWWYGHDTLTTAFTDVDTRKGYRISFFPPGNAALDHYVTLQFSEYPQSGTAYQLTTSDPASGQVKVLLETGVIPGYKSQSGGGSVTVGMVEGKFSFSGDQLHLLRDTITSAADALDLGFRLKAF